MIGAVCVVGAMVASGASAIVLHGAQARPDAVGVLPIAGIWAIAALVGSRALPQRVAAVLVVAALVRLPLVGTPPLLSDDVYRYLWEGTALLAGHNPFIEAPATIDGLDDTLRARVNHPGIPSIYPPVALGWFALLATLGATVPIAQALTAAVDVLVAGAIARALRVRGAPIWPAWLYALHPLPAIESAASAHLEIVAILPTVLAVSLAPAAGVFAAWIGAGAKLFPAILLPALYRRTGPRGAIATVGALALIGLLALPVLGAGADLLVAMRTYSAHWSFNGLLFPWIDPWLGAATRPVLVAIGAVACATSVVRGDGPLRLWATAGAAFVLLSPTVHPWYVLWALVPSLLLGRAGWAIASVFLLGSYAVLLAYDPITGAWEEAPWLWWITWPPAVAALVVTRDLPLVQPRSEASPTAP